MYYNISAFQKIQKEAPFHALTNAGHISYVELDGDICKNIDAFESVIRCMKEAGIGYGSVNHPVDRDPVCGYNGIIGDVCPRCGRHAGEGVPIEKLAELRKKYTTCRTTRIWSTERGARRQRLYTFKGALHGGLPPVGLFAIWNIDFTRLRGRTAGGGQRNRRKIYVTEIKEKTVKDSTVLIGEGRDFERIRRITGYLVGTTDRWNNAKRAEERDRVKHSL